MREILRISCAHFSDSFHQRGKDFKEQASHRRDEGRKNIEDREYISPGLFSFCAEQSHFICKLLNEN